MESKPGEVVDWTSGATLKGGSTMAEFKVGDLVTANRVTPSFTTFCIYQVIGISEYLGKPEIVCDAGNGRTQRGPVHTWHLTSDSSNPHVQAYEGKPGIITVVG